MHMGMSVRRRGVRKNAAPQPVRYSEEVSARKSQFVGNDDTGRGKGFQDADDPLPGFRIQPVGGLVEQQGFRLHHKDRSQRNQFLLAPGQAVRQPVFEPGQPEPLQRGRRTIPGFVLSAAKIRGPKATSSNTVGQKS